MNVWLPFLLAATTQATVEVQVPVTHYRPSKMVALMRGDHGGTSLLGDRLEAVPVDAKGIIVLSGDKTEVEAAKQFVALTDVERRGASFTITIDSSADRMKYEVRVSLKSNQLWKTSDGDTDTTIAMKPRINADGSVSLSLVTQVRSSEVQTMVRLKAGQTIRVSPNSEEETVGRIVEGRAVKSYSNMVPAPRITVRCDRLDLPRRRR
jgi:type II secretory pathway component GspD/PulD (secretin)